MGNETMEVRQLYFEDSEGNWQKFDGINEIEVMAEPSDEIVATRSPLWLDTERCFSCSCNTCLSSRYLKKLLGIKEKRRNRLITKALKRIISA